VLAGEGPAGSGSVTPGTVEETVLARLIDTPALQRPLRRRPGRRPPGLAPVVDHVENRSIYNTRSSPGDQPRSLAACFRPSGPPACRRPPGGSTDAERALLRVLPRRGDVAAHDLGVGVVGAQHPQPVGQGLLVQRDGPAQIPRRQADRSAERSASDA
jgi:hypothetical protein